MRVAGFMSGSGTNLVRLLEHQKRLGKEEGRPVFEVAFIFSDRGDGRSSGEKIGRDWAIPHVSYDIRSFHRLKKAARTVKTRKGMALRQEYDRLARTLIRAFEVDLIALGGYMSFITLTPCVNVHPADLSILAQNGARRFVGDDAVMEAIRAGQRELRSSTIWTDMGVDTGPLLMVSEPVAVELPVPLEELLDDEPRLRRVAEEHQERLKEAGDWVVFPRTVEAIARGRFAFDRGGGVLFDGRPAPGGVRPG